MKEWSTCGIKFLKFSKYFCVLNIMFVVSMIFGYLFEFMGFRWYTNIVLWSVHGNGPNYKPYKHMLLANIKICKLSTIFIEVLFNVITINNIFLYFQSITFYGNSGSGLSIHIYLPLESDRDLEFLSSGLIQTQLQKKYSHTTKKCMKYIT